MIQDKNNWAQRLSEQARILGESRMIRDEQPLTDELTAAVVLRFQQFLKRNDKSAEWAARSMAIGASTLSQLVNGQYQGDVEAHVRKLDKWLEQQILRENAPKPGGFVRTSVAERIYGAAKLAQEMGTIAMVHGPAGVGKTIAAQAIRAETPGSVYVTIVRPGLSQLSVLESLTRALRMTGLKFTGAQLFNQVVELIRDTNRLIIVDEVHQLEGRRKDESLHCLRHLHDATGCPMLWLGMSSLAKYVLEGKTKYDQLDQLSSRIGWWEDLTAVATGTDGGPGKLYTVEDVQKWLNAQKIRVTPDGVRLLRTIANLYLGGGLRTAGRVVQLAVKAVGAERAIGADVVRAFWVKLSGAARVQAAEAGGELEDAGHGPAAATA